MRATQARRRFLRAAVLLAGSLVAAAPRTVDEELRRLADAEGQGRALVRIGLDSGHVLRVSSDRPFRILDPATGQAEWSELYRGEMTIVAEGGPEGEVASVYRIQVGAFSGQAAAEAERARVEKTYGASGVVHYDPDRGSWRLRLGQAKDREELVPLLERLRAGGLQGVWITEEPAETRTAVRLRLVDSSYDSRPSRVDRLAVVPAPGSRVQVEGKPYRGIIEVRLTRYGTVRAIDWVELENYLLGVVPAELGPELWPQLEALKAQAVAARTYAWRNRGQFQNDGYDLCATPRCQVYSGAAAENPLSDQAVAMTRGEILTWEGKPISALYTATCGGHTEDGAEVFPEERAPYLKGVPCRAEGDALATLRVVLEGMSIEPVIAETGEDVTRDWALLAAAGVVDARAEASAPLVSAELRAWTTSLARLAGRPAPQGSPGEVSSLGKAALTLLEETGWTERARVLLSEPDLPAILRDPDAIALPIAERRALAYLALTGALSPFPDGKFAVGRPPSRARMAAAVARIGEAYEAFGLKEAVVAPSNHKGLKLLQGRGEVRVPLAPKPFLFGLGGERVVPFSRLELLPGDRVRFRRNPGGHVDFLEVRPPIQGVSDDRSARVYSWQVRQTRAEIEEAVNRRLSVGTLRDLVIGRRGVSGRVLELKVVGDKGSTVVKGFDVRTLLGLRESLTVIEPQRDASGRIEAVVFAGKGWGHGVGLCQVGAYGMAVRGAGYREFMGHYYRGAVLEKISPSAR